MITIYTNLWLIMFMCHYQNDTLLYLSMLIPVLWLNFKKSLANIYQLSPPKNSSHQFSRQFMSMSLITTNETPHVVWTTLTNLDRLSLLMNAVVDIFHASNLNAMLPMGLAYIDIWSDIYDVMNNVVEIDVWWNMVWKGLIIWFVLWIVNQEISSTDT